MNGMIKKVWIGLTLCVGLLAGVNAGAVTALTASPQVLVFADPVLIGTESVAQTVTLTATGAGGTVTFGALGVANQNFSMLENTCTAPLVVDTNPTCTFKVRFTPEAGGTRYAELVVFSDAGAPGTFSPQYIYLQGTGFGAPGAPSGVSAAAGNVSATVSFSAPVSNGAIITGYTVVSNPAGGTDSNVGTTLLSHAVTGLTNGTPYTFTVTAAYSGGNSVPSAPSNAVTPASVPAAPTLVTATQVSATSVSVSFAAPASNGGSPVTGYTVTSIHAVGPADGADSNAGTNGLAHLVTGLTTDASYFFQVKATNAMGQSLDSAPSNVVTLTAPTVPGAPTIGTATAGNAQATVTFAAGSTGGSPITGYTVTSSPAGGVDSNAGTTGLSHTITGLANGTAYTFTVIATNSVGNSGASGASNSVTPAAITVPGAPTIGAATGGNAQATVTFAAPASNGGAAITGYTVTSSPAGGVDSNAGTTGLSHTITGLTNGTAYTFTVTATNSQGSGAASAASNPVTPAVAAAGGDRCAANGVTRKNNLTAMNWGTGVPLPGLNLRANEAYVWSFNPVGGGTVRTLYSGANKIITISRDICGFDTPVAGSATCKVQQNTATRTTEAGPKYATVPLAGYCELPALPAGQTYYVNVRNAVSGSSSLCTNAAGCTFYIQY